MATESVQSGLGQRPPYHAGAGSPDSRFQNSVTRGYARRRQAPNFNARTLAEGLGWFSVALGAAEILTPGIVRSVTGVGRPGTLRSAASVSLRRASEF